MINPNYINILTLIITLIGFYFAYFQYFKFIKEKKIHLLKILDGQLDCLGPWVGSDNGNGYGDELTEDQKYENALPSKVIYNTGSSPLIDSTNILEAMSEVPILIIGEINQLYYDIKRIESIQNYRNLLTSSDLKLSNSINRKIIKFRMENPHAPFHHFLMTYKNEDDLEKGFVEQLVSYGHTLHCKIIGNKNNGASQHWTKIKEWITNENKGEKKPNCVFVILTFVVVTIFLFLVLTLFNYFVSTNVLILISILITSFLSLSSSAISCDYFKFKYKQ